MRFARQSTLLAGIVTAVMVLSVTAAHAEPEPSSTLEAISGILPEEVSATASAIETAESLTVAGDGGQFLTVPLTDESEISLTSDAGDVGLSLPLTAAAEAPVEEAPGVYSFDNEDGSTVVPLPQEDGSVRVLVTIADSTAPTSYDFPLSVPDDATVSLGSDGFVQITASDGQPLGSILPPWAIDANGDPVATHFELTGLVLTQVVEHTVTTVYPVVADPYMGKNLISKVDVSSENGYPRYLVYPTAYGTAVTAWGNIAPGQVDALAGKQIMQTKGWDEVVKKRSAAKDRASVKQQFDCHTVYAANKESYNLEAWRPSRSNWLTSPVQCNWQ